MRPGGVREAGRAAARALTAGEGVRRRIRALSRRGLVPRAVWVRLPVEGTFTVEVPGGGAFRYQALAADLMGRLLYWRGVEDWERETFAVAARLCRRARDFWDVGANTGPFTLLACAVNPRLRAWAFEPVPEVFARLRANVRLNGWEGRASLHGVAVGARPGTAPLHVPAGHVLPTSASLDPAGFRGLPGTLVDVPVVTLAGVCPPGAPLDLVKIDVEGFEDAVLEGLGPRLSEREPALIVEVNADGPHEALGRRLAPLGYAFFHLGPRGPEARAGLVPDPAEEFRNYLCLPASKRGWLDGP